MSGLSAEVDAILALFPLDDTGHVTDCGYDETDMKCDCYTLPTRLTAAVDQIANARVKAALEAAASEIDRIAAEHASEDEADGCESRFCRGWLLGQVNAARIVRAAGDTT